MTKFNGDFYWDKENQNLIYNIGVDYDTSNLYYCKLAIKDKTLVQITPMNSFDNYLLNKNNAYELVKKISEKEKKIINFIVQNSKKETFNFIKSNNTIIPVEKSNVQITPDNVAERTEENMNINIKGKDKLETEEVNKIKEREFDEHNEKNIPNWIERDQTFILKGPVEKIKTNDPLLSEEQLKLFSSGKLDKINYEFSDENNETEFGIYTTKNGMGDLLMIQNVVTSEEPKSPENMFNYLKKQLKKISDNFSIPKINESIDIINEKNQQIIKKEKKNNELKKRQKKDPSYFHDLPLIYIKFINRWMKGQGNKAVEGSGRFYNAMTSYFPEFITPFVPLYASQNLNCIGNEESKRAINLLKTKILGSSDTRLDSELIKKATISYPLGKTNPLYDSVLIFPSTKYKSRCILLSTKGGRTGLGAMASAGGLKSFLYNSDGVIPQKIFSDCKNKHFDASLYSNAYLPYIIEFANQSPNNAFALKVLSSFILSSSDYYQEIIDSICNVVTKNKKNKRIISIPKTKRERAEFVETWLNSDESIQKCVLSALTYGSYGFAQINSKQISVSGEDFIYEYTIQYPAIFTGHIDFSFIKGYEKNKTPIYKKLQFHIIGNK